MIKSISNKIYYLGYALFAYVIIQFSWWAYLIYQQSTILKGEKEAFWMVFGEGSVFLCLLITGFYIILKYIAQLKQQQQQQHDFLLSITHELKTPITSNKLVLQTLKKDLKEEQKKRLISRALQQTDRLSLLVDNVLNTARIDTGFYNIHPEKISIETLLKKIANQMQLVYQHDYQITKNTLKTPDFYTDSFLVESMLKNLIENAFKYAQQNSKIKITFNIDKQHAAIYIQNATDTHKIKKEGNKLFKRFYRASTVQNGTGLGLYIVKSFSQLLKGYCSFSIEKNHVCFQLNIPNKINKTHE